MTLSRRIPDRPDEAGGRLGARWDDVVRAARDDGDVAGSEKSRVGSVADIAAMIDRGAGDASYDAGVLRALVALLHALRDPREPGVVAYRRGVSVLVASLRPATVSRLLRGSPSNAERRSLVLVAAEVLEPRATVVLLGGAAHAAGQPLPLPLARLLWKLGASVAGGPSGEGGEDPGERAFRDQIRRLAGRWWISSGQDFGGRQIGAGEEAFSRPGDDERLPDELVTDPERIVRISLRVDTTGLALWAPLRRLSAVGHTGEVLRILREAPAGSRAARAIAHEIGSPQLLGDVLREDPVDFELVDVLVDALELSTTEVLLDSLTESESRATRRGVFSRLVRLGEPVAAHAADRLRDSRWFVQRNVLALLRELEVWPDGTAVEPFLEHDDPRVRREAVQALALIPPFRDRAITAALDDPDWKVVRFGIYAAGNDFREDWVPRLARRMSEADFPAALCLPAVGVLASSRRPEALERLLALVVQGRTLVGQPRLMPTSPSMLRALAVIAQRWAPDPRAAAVLKRAGRSRDPAVRDALGRHASGAEE